MLYNNYNGDDYNINYLNFDRQYDKSRKRKYPKYTKSKRIYISPNFKHESIKLMKKLLQQKLNAPKKVAKMQAISKIGNKVSIPVIKKINSDKKYIIKLYFTDWCPHCSQFKPIWNKLKSRFSNNFEFIDVDCTNNSPNLPYVEGYPTISLFNMNNQHLNNYEDDRNYESIETYLNLLN
jgi:thiol-disulfide isomerase/thioredoxin